VDSGIPQANTANPETQTQQSNPVKRKLSPRTVAKIKVVTQKKVVEFKRDIISGDDFEAMKRLVN